MRRTLAIALIVAGFALPASALDAPIGCMAVEVSHRPQGPRVEAVDWTGLFPDELRYSMNGYYLWISWGFPVSDDPWEGATSYDMSDDRIELVIACQDGSVEIIYTQPSQPEPTEPSVSPDPAVPDRKAEPAEPLPELPDVERWCVEYVDLTFWCSLPSRGVFYSHKIS